MEELQEDGMIGRRGTLIANRRGAELFSNSYGGPAGLGSDTANVLNCSGEIS